MRNEPKTLSVIWLSSCQRFTLPQTCFHTGVINTISKLSAKTNRMLDQVIEECSDDDGIKKGMLIKAWHKMKNLKNKSRIADLISKKFLKNCCSGNS